MKFISDAMHGHIARFLRLLGYDTFYPGNLDDTKILEIAENEDRIIITRDIQLANRAKSRNITVILLTSTDFIENLNIIYKKLSINLDLDSNKSRCPICNSEIRPIQKELVKGKVHDKTYNKFNEFWICENPNCRKIYYVGIHWEKIYSQLEKVKNFKKD
ncbi:MAG: Mut7-C RNAse domain-containing protein [Candidatus Helarchaeota archaeon]